MKCLITHGSPLRGNTFDVLNRVKEEMKKDGLQSLIIFELWRNLSKNDDFSIDDFKFWNNDSLNKNLYFEYIPVIVMKKLIASTFKNILGL